MIEELIKRLIEKDDKAFEEVYNIYNKIVYWVIFKIVRDREVSKDLVQETFLTMYNRIEQYSGNGNFKYWLLQIAKNKAKNHLKKISMENKMFVTDTDIFENINDNSMDIEGFVNKIRDILDSTSTDIIILKIIFDYTFKEIAKSLNMSLSDVYRKYKKAIEKIKDHIEIR